METIIYSIQGLGNLKYLILFIMYTLEGPFSNFLSAVLAGNGVFNIWYIFVLASFAEIFADIVIFVLGRLGKKTKLEKILCKADNLEFFKLIQKYLYNNTFITMLLVKSAPGVAVYTLLYVGRSKLRAKKFLIAIIPASILRNALISGLGYFSYVSVEKVLKYHGYTSAIGYILFLIIIVVILFMERRNIQSYLARLLDKIFSKISK